MNPVKKAVSLWIAVVTEHAKKDLAHLAELTASGASLETISAALIGAQVSTEIVRRLEDLQLSLFCDAAPSELFTLIQEAGIHAIDDMVRRHADPVGALDEGWTITEHTRATAAARVVQGSRWVLAEIEKASAPDATDGGSAVSTDKQDS